MPVDIPATLGRKYGPLPGYAWFAIAGVGTYVIIRRRRSTSGGASSSSTEAGDTGQAGGGDQATGDYTDSAGYEAGYSGGYQQGVGDAYDYGGFLNSPTDQALVDDVAGLTAAERKQNKLLRKILKQMDAHPAKKGRGADRPAHKGHHRPPPAKGHPASSKPHNPNRPHRPAGPARSGHKPAPSKNRKGARR